jgi:hypothetical protein
MKPAQARRQSPGAAGATRGAQDAQTPPESTRKPKTPIGASRTKRKALGASTGLAAITKTPKRSKFNNTKVSLDSYRFDSQAEGRRYMVLRDRLRKGEITDLAVHPSFVLSVKGVLIGKYTPDFAYTVVATKERVVEDVKSKATITEAYKLRKKLMWACHRVRVVEVLAA